MSRGTVVFITQQIDPEHPTLGAVVPMVRALAAESEEVAVLALRAVPGVLPANCSVTTFGAPTRVGRTARFALALGRELRSRPRAVIAHMSPIYALLAAPVARPLGVPVILWFTHWRSRPLLQAATFAASAVATADSGSFPGRSPKVAGIGHAIDVDALACRPTPSNDALHALALGRTSRIKGLDTIVAATRRARELGTKVELEIRGPSENTDERAYRGELVALAGADITVAEPVSWTAIPDLFRRTDVLVNATTSGSLDKTVLEACASCVPAIASSPPFAELLPDELRFSPGDAQDLAARIAAFAGLSHDRREALGHELRRKVEAQHSVHSWARRILELAERS